MKRILRNSWVWMAFLLAGTSCTEDAMLIEPEVSHGKSTEAVETLEGIGKLNSAAYPQSDIVQLYIGSPMEAENPDFEMEEEVYVELPTPATKNLILRVAVNGEFRTVEQYRTEYVDAFSKEHYMTVNAINDWQGGVDKYIQVGDATEATVTIAAGQRKSSSAKIIFKRDADLPSGSSILYPLIAMDAETEENYGRIDYIIHTTDRGIRAERGFTAVAYVNTEVMNPLIADQFTMKVEKYVWDPYEVTLILPLAPAIDIVNVRTAMLKNEQGRAMLRYTTDMEYVLKRNDMYIQPMRKRGMKVCLTIKGGGTGMGFCNLTDEQISDFAAQVKVTLNLYGLDGVNLWDDTDYAKEGIPPVRNVSYAKLIKTLKESMPGKLITLMDTPETTASLRQVQDGISAGQYLDYAWSPIAAFLNPYADGAELKPIAGMEMMKYGTASLPMMSSKMPAEEQDEIVNNLFTLVDGMTVVNSQLFVFDDLGYTDYGDESLVSGTLFFPGAILYDMNPELESPEFLHSYMTSVDSSNAATNYYGFRKDW